MIDNSKEYILCAAYPFKKDYITPCMKEINAKMKDGDNLKGDIRNIYHNPHRQVFNMAVGWRHCDILYKYGDCIEHDLGGFMTSRGRYVDRKEAAKIAKDCGQIEKDIDMLYSEDLY